MAYGTAGKSALATWYGEEIEVTFTANLILNDYGVRGSPTWLEVEDIEIDELTILGHTLSQDAIKELPKELLDELYGYAYELEEEAWGSQYD